MHHSPQSTPQIWAALRHDGPNHLGFVVKGGLLATSAIAVCPGLYERGGFIGEEYLARPGRPPAKDPQSAMSTASCYCTFTGTNGGLVGLFRRL